jgi:signal transduction histidine kinase
MDLTFCDVLYYNNKLMFIFIIILSALVQGLVALFVLQRNPKSLTNILFFILSAFVAVWAVINFVITNDPFSSSQLSLYRLLMASVVIQNTFFYLFSHTYPEGRVNVKRKVLVLYLLLSAITVVVALSPILFTKVQYGAGGARPVGGPGMLIFILQAGISVVTGLRSIFKRYSHARGASKQQLWLVFLGSIVLWGVVPITNFVISMATQTLFFARISPIYTLAFSSIIAYAIVAKKMFNIQAAVARSVAYTLTALFIASTYVVVAFITSSVLFNLHSIDLRIQAVYIVLALVLAISFQSVKKVFDHVTNRLFYQDAYDPQELIRKLNRVLVATVGLNELLTQTLKLLEENLGPDFAVVALIIPKMNEPYIVSTSKKTFASEDLDKAHSKIVLAKTHEQVIATDYLGDDEDSLRQLLDKNNIALMAQLKDETLKTGNEMGHIILGPKKSGNPYSRQDIRVMESISNELVVAIQSALRFDEIQQFNITLQQKIEEETRKLRKTNERLKVLDETKDDFISMASHQLRTPLTSVKGYISLVLDGDAGPIKANQRKLLTQAFISSQRMVYLIADLLNVSRLKTGKFIIEAAPVNLADVIQEEIEQLVETAQGRSLTLSYHKPAHFPVLQLDETKIRQVAMNFMDNAIYYTPAGGHIEAKLTETPKTIEFRVIDDGIGVPKEEAHHLFTKFYRAKNAQHARPDGTGLGLFMAQKVVVAQGGAIIFSSKEGHGSTFGFTFPKDKLQAPAEQPAKTA